MQHAVRVDRDVACYTRLIQCREACLQVIHEGIEVGVRLVRQAKRGQIPVALRIPLSRRDQQLIAFAK